MITYPLPLSAFQDRLNVVDQVISLDGPLTQSVTSAGATAGVQPIAARWSVQFKLAPVARAQGAEIIALMRMIKEPSARFLVSPIIDAVPQSDPTGSVSASTVIVASVGVEKVTLALTGLPAAFALNVGDYLSIAVGSIPHFHQIIEAATANGSGVTPEFQVVPPLSVSVAAAQAVTLVNPTMLASADPGAVRDGAQMLTLAQSGSAFTARSELA